MSDGWVLVTRGRVVFEQTANRSQMREGAGKSSREVWGSDVKWSEATDHVRGESEINNNLIQEWS